MILKIVIRGICTIIWRWFYRVVEMMELRYERLSTVWRARALPCPYITWFTNFGNPTGPVQPCKVNMFKVNCLVCAKVPCTSLEKPSTYTFSTRSHELIIFYITSLRNINVRAHRKPCLYGLRTNLIWKSVLHR